MVESKREQGQTLSFTFLNEIIYLTNRFCSIFAYEVIVVDNRNLSNLQLHYGIEEGTREFFFIIIISCFKSYTI